MLSLVTRIRRVLPLLLVAGFAGAAPTPAQQPAKPAAANVDSFGDPLPQGAIARLGTVRLRHGSSVVKMCFLPNGDRLASVDNGGTLSVWDVTTGKSVRTLQHDSWALGLAVSPDGSLLVSGGLHDVCVWDAATGKALRRLDSGGQHALELAFSPDGKRLAAGCNDGKVRLWDVATWKPLRTLDAHPKNGYVVVAFSPDGKTLATGGTDAILRLWDVEAGQMIRQFKGHTRRVLCVAFAPDGKTLASGSEGATLRLWDVTSGRELWQTRTPMTGVAFAPDGKTLLSTGEGTVGIRIWDAATGKLLRSFPGRRDDGRALALSADGKLVALGGSGCAVRLWEVATGQERFADRGSPSDITTFAFSPDGKQLAGASTFGPLQLWHLDTGRRVPLLDFSEKHFLLHVLYTADGKRLLTLGPGGQFWNPATGKPVGELAVPPVSYGHVNESPRGTFFLTSWTPFERVTVWEVNATREEKRAVVTLPRETVLVTRTVCVGEKTYGVVTTFDGRLLIVDAISGKMLLERQLAGPLESVATSHDGRYLAGAESGTKSLGIWEFPTGKLLRRLDMAPGGVLDLSFSPDARLLAATDLEKKIRVWEVASGKEVRQFSGHLEYARRLAFAPHGRILATTGTDTTVLLWDITGRLHNGKLAAAKFDEKGLDALWDVLGDEDAAKAYAALWQLVAAGQQTVEFLGIRLTNRAFAHEAVPRLVGELGDKRFAVREKATRDLAALGGRAVPLLQRALLAEQSAETKRRIEKLLAALPGGKGNDVLRRLRSVQILEEIGTSEARQVLLEVARDDAAGLASEVQRALERLRKRHPAAVERH
ncbi:MAG TPA: hypothetical protein VEL76_13180 [Gemmataceae bacterium]|nr:hypothetical protein [Gemmataceae bacterium]